MIRGGPTALAVGCVMQWCNTAVGELLPQRRRSGGGSGGLEQPTRAPVLLRCSISCVCIVYLYFSSTPCSSRRCSWSPCRRLCAPERRNQSQQQHQRCALRMLTTSPDAGPAEVIVAVATAEASATAHVPSLQCRDSIQ